MQFVFLEVIFFGVFSSKFGKIWAKILHTPKNLPAHLCLLSKPFITKWIVGKFVLSICLRKAAVV